MNITTVFPAARRCPALLLVLSLFGVGNAWATDEASSADTKAAALNQRAAQMQANDDKECLKVPPAARPQCREQLARAMQRLRDRAVRVR